MRRRSHEHALIVGGSSGAGRAAARRFLSAGYAVSILSRRPPTASQRLRDASYFNADIGSLTALRPALRDVVAKNGKPSAVAFFQRYRGDGDRWHGELRTSLFGTKNVIDALLGDFKLKNCSIVVVSSVNAWLISKGATVGYHVAKACLNQLVRDYAWLVGPRQIRVNSVSPGTFIKRETEQFFAEAQPLTTLRAQLIPLRRLGAAEEVADAVFFLASAKSSIITGQNVVVDGGLSLVYQEELVRHSANESEAGVSLKKPVGKNVTAAKCLRPVHISRKKIAEIA
jgi:NAD(P)-dependent dehydrogenase (short-subunit alcohol dehydrogenase family)